MYCMLFKYVPTSQGNVHMFVAYNLKTIEPILIKVLDRFYFLRDRYEENLKSSLNHVTKYNKFYIQSILAESECPYFKYYTGLISF